MKVLLTILHHVLHTILYGTLRGCGCSCMSEVVQMSFELCSGLGLWHYMRCVHMAGRQSFRAAATALFVNPLQEDFLVLQLCLPLQHCWGGVKPSIGHAVTPMVVLVRLLAHAAAVYCALTGIAGCGSLHEFPA